MLIVSYRGRILTGGYGIHSTYSSSIEHDNPAMVERKTEGDGGEGEKRSLKGDPATRKRLIPSKLAFGPNPAMFISGNMADQSSRSH